MSLAVIESLYECRQFAIQIMLRREEKRREEKRREEKRCGALSAMVRDRLMYWSMIILATGIFGMTLGSCSGGSNA